MPTRSQPFELCRITPGLARDFLSKNVAHNRRLKPAKIAAFARDMENGKWRITHQAIAFDWNGELVDGQNRLSAIIKSKTTIEMWVYRGLNPDDFTVLDSGTARGAHDFLHRHGFANSTAVAAAARLTIRYWSRLARLHGEGLPGYPSNSKMAGASHSEIEQFCLANSAAVEEAASLAKRVHREFRHLRIASVAALYLICHEIDPYLCERVVDFVSRVASGADLTAASPELCFRKYLEVTTPRTHNLNSTDFSLAVLIKAYNCYLSQRPMRRFNPGSLDPFPMVNA